MKKPFLRRLEQHHQQRPETLNARPNPKTHAHLPKEALDNVVIMLYFYHRHRSYLQRAPPTSRTRLPRARQAVAEHGDQAPKFQSQPEEQEPLSVVLIFMMSSTNDSNSNTPIY